MLHKRLAQNFDVWYTNYEATALARQKMQTVINLMRAPQLAQVTYRT